MEQLIKKYEEKLVAHHLALKDDIVIAGQNVDLIWNQESQYNLFMEKIFSKLNINSLMFVKPAEPYFTILKKLAKQYGNRIVPEDSETRTFLHELPVITDLDAEAIVSVLKRRKSVIIPDHGIVTYGTVSPEQAFVVLSSNCFSGFVKYFSDYLYASRRGTLSQDEKEEFSKITSFLKPYPSFDNTMAKSPFNKTSDIYSAIEEAGSMTVEYGLVDSFFGNISYRDGKTVFISQTGSSLDELTGCIDPCPMDNSTCAGLTASSELSAHKSVYEDKQIHAIVHGHPKFSVIMSLFCEKDNCEFKGRCHTHCKEKRFLEDIPIVPGEVGTGRYGLCNTMPPAINGKRGVIVYGHGVFAVGKTDFNEAFKNMLDIEKMCRDKYFRLINPYT